MSYWPKVNFIIINQILSIGYAGITIPERVLRMQNDSVRDWKKVSHFILNFEV